MRRLQASGRIALYLASILSFAFAGAESVSAAEATEMPAYCNLPDTSKMPGEDALKRALPILQSRMYDRALCWLLVSAGKGNANAMVTLGAFYADANTGKLDYITSLDWYRKAAILGDGLAMYRIGMIYENGTGVTSNHEEAIRWIRLSATRGEKRGIQYLNKVQHDLFLIEAIDLYKSLRAQEYTGYDQILSDGSSTLHLISETKTKDDVDFSVVLTCVNEQKAVAQAAELMLWAQPRDAASQIAINKFVFWRTYEWFGPIETDNTIKSKLSPGKLRIFSIKNLHQLPDEQRSTITKGAISDFIGRETLLANRTFAGIMDNMNSATEDYKKATRFYYNIIFAEAPLTIGVRYTVEPSGKQGEASLQFPLTKLRAARSRFLQKCGMPDPLS